MTVVMAGECEEQEGYLPSVGGYENTSFKIYGGQPPNVRLPFVRGWWWKLPYRSTIVAAIAPKPSQPNEYEIAGYLCVDSNSRGTFRKDIDVALVTGIADCLYEIVYRYGMLTQGAAP